MENNDFELVNAWQRNFFDFENYTWTVATFKLRDNIIEIQKDEDQAKPYYKINIRFISSTEEDYALVTNFLDFKRNILVFDSFFIGCDLDG